MQKLTIITFLALCSTLSAAPVAPSAVPVLHQWRDPAMEVDEIHISTKIANRLEPWDPTPFARFLSFLRPLGRHQLEGMPPVYYFEAGADAEIPALGEVVFETIRKANAARIKYDAWLQVPGSQAFAIRASAVDLEETTILTIQADGQCQYGEALYSAADFAGFIRREDALVARHSFQIFLPRTALDSAAAWHGLALILRALNKTDEWGNARWLYRFWLMPNAATPGSSRASGKR